MALTCGFFNSVDGDRLYSAEQITKFFDGIVSDGVYETIGERFAVTASTDGMAVNVGSGRAIIRSHWVENSAGITLALEPADVQYNRTDYIVLRLDTAARSVDLIVKRGNSSAGSPEFVEPVRNAQVYEIYLAGVRINKGASVPTYIIDMRPSSWCGWVTGAVRQVDTSDLFTQWETAYARMYAQFDAYMQAKEAAFDAWYASLTHDLAVQAAITSYQHTEEITEQTIGCPIGIREYQDGVDVLIASVNGVVAEPGSYDIISTGDGPYMVFRDRWMDPGDKASFVVLKNVVGKGVSGAGITAPILSGAAGTGGIPEIMEEEES